MPSQNGIKSIIKVHIEMISMCVVSELDLGLYILEEFNSKIVNFMMSAPVSTQETSSKEINRRK